LNSFYTDSFTCSLLVVRSSSGNFSVGVVSDQFALEENRGHNRCCGSGPHYSLVNPMYHYHVADKCSGTDVTTKLQAQ
jgi:hypothetical protein